MVNGKHSDPYEEPQERNVRVFFKLKVNEDPTLKNMPLEEDFDILICKCIWPNVQSSTSCFYL